MELEEELKEANPSKLISPIVRLSKYQRQEIYEFIPANTLYTKISKLSKQERAFMIEIKNGQERILTIFPPCIERADDYDIDFWIYLLSFAHQFNISVK